MPSLRKTSFTNTRTYSSNFLRGYIQGVRSNIMYTCAWAEYYDLCFRLSTRKHTSNPTKIVCKFVLVQRTTTTDFASVLESDPQKSQANSDIIKNFCNRNLYKPILHLGGHSKIASKHWYIYVFFSGRICKNIGIGSYYKTSERKWQSYLLI